MFHLKELRKFGVYLYMASLFLHLLRRRREFDVIHVHSATVSALVAAFAGRKLGKPVVMKVMASGQWGDFKRMRAGEHLAGAGRFLRRLLDVDRVVCLNREVEEECLEEGFRADQLFSVPNGFPIEEVAAREVYPDREELDVVFSGRLDGQKNPALLLEAAAMAKASRAATRIRLSFLGDGGLRSSLEERARALGLEERARFLGRVADVPGHLAGADIFVLPSLSEGISNALLEAMAHGLPCIATDIPGNRDLVEDGRTGILVPPGDASALSSALLRLAGDRALRESLGRAGRRLVEDRFDLRKVAGRYAAMYRELAQAPRA
jgi:glycosyltransferase involved in cell wall biosynthesis